MRCAHRSKEDQDVGKMTHLKERSTTSVLIQLTEHKCYDKCCCFKCQD